MCERQGKVIKSLDSKVTVTFPAYWLGSEYLWFPGAAIIRGLKQHHLYCSVGQKSSQPASHWLASRCRQGCVTSGGSRGESISLPYPAPRSCPNSLAWDLSFQASNLINHQSQQSHHSDFCFCCHISFSASPLSLITEQVWPASSLSVLDPIGLPQF